MWYLALRITLRSSFLTRLELTEFFPQGALILDVCNVINTYFTYIAYVSNCCSIEILRNWIVKGKIKLTELWELLSILILKRQKRDKFPHSAVQVFLFSLFFALQWETTWIPELLPSYLISQSSSSIFMFQNFDIFFLSKK